MTCPINISLGWPEDDIIDLCSLTKFRKIRLKDSTLLDMLIGKTLQIAIKKGIIQSKTIIIDFTHTKARYNLNETITDDLTHLQASPDVDAQVGQKTADSSFFGYKTHLAMGEERIITAAVGTSGEKNDGKQLSA